MKLHREGLISNGDRDCWHIYALRHSFKTEAEHAGVKSGIVEFLMGDNKGIAWTYDNRDQLHPSDFEQEYAKVEPYISMNPSEVVHKKERTWCDSGLDRVCRYVSLMHALVVL